MVKRPSTNIFIVISVKNIKGFFQIYIIKNRINKKYYTSIDKLTLFLDLKSFKNTRAFIL